MTASAVRKGNLAVAPKSNAAYMAFNEVNRSIRETGTLDVPMHLRNAPTRMMKDLGYGKGYQYDHDAEGGIAIDQQCLPEELVDAVFYNPTTRGLEGKYRDKMEALRIARRAKRAPSLTAADDLHPRAEEQSERPSVVSSKRDTSA